MERSSQQPSGSLGGSLHRGIPISTDLTPLDVSVISILQTDGRRSFSSIARELDVDEKALRRRVTDLRRQGVVNITTISSPAHLGYNALALVAIWAERPYSSTEMAADLAKIDSVDYLAITAGSIDLLVEVVCKDMSELQETVERVINHIPGVRHTEILPYLRPVYYNPVSGRLGASPNLSTQESPRRLDATDKAIISALTHDGRTPLMHIAKDLGLSESGVRQRYRALTDSGALRVVAVVNPSSIGLRAAAWLGIQARHGVSIDDLVRRLAGVSAVSYVIVCAGRFDIFAEVVCSDNRDLLEVLDLEVRTLPGIARLEPFITMKMRIWPLRPPF